ncbi:MAG: Transcriptional repressor PaaX [Candidatus Celerinatantimonas neptuna]|nr:MAG: Transcriptional repressor PaaX [Candidatus Celerinatantimonas neptuna]
MIKSKNSQQTENRQDLSSTQSILLTLFGLFLFDSKEREYLQTRWIVAALSHTGLSENAIRTTLNRMVKRNLLLRRQSGRISLFSLSKEGQKLLSHGHERIYSEAPFSEKDKKWTLLNVSSTLAKNIRYQFEVRLQLGGFAAIDSRLWIAPGNVDVIALIHDLIPHGLFDSLYIFQAEPTQNLKTDQLINKAWDIEQIRLMHHRFIKHWTGASTTNKCTLTNIIQLVNDWTNLLCCDPGLPGAQIDAQWPAKHSEIIFKQLYQSWRHKAEEEFNLIERTI